MEGSSQGREEADKRLSLAMLPLFPSTNPHSILWLFNPPPKYCPGMQTLGSAPSRGLLPSARGRFLWQPLSPSPHLLPVSPSPEQGFPTAELLRRLDSESRGGKVFKAKTAIDTWHNAQALSPQDTLGI